MNVVIERPHGRTRNFLALALGLAVFFSSTIALGFLAQRSEAAPVTASAVLLETEESPWGDNSNEERMEEALGSSGWERQEFSTVQADSSLGGLFARSVEFIWIEGSDGSTIEANAFVEAHEAQLKAFVARGGSLFINSASNQGVTIEFEGRQVGYAEGDNASDEVEILPAGASIFSAPSPLTSTVFFGGDFAEGDVTGAAVTPLIVNAEPGPEEGIVAFGTYTSGSGHVALGTMTMPQFQSPEAEAEALRVDLVAYLKGVATPGPAEVVTPVTTPTPVATTTPAPVAMCIVPKLNGMTLKQAKAALKKADCGLDKVARKKSVSLKTGGVIRQRPVPGTVRGAGSEVSFRLGRG